MSCICSQLIRDGSPRSALATTERPGCSLPGTVEAKSHCAWKYGWRVPPEYELVDAEVSPASSARDGEKVWSL